MYKLNWATLFFLALMILFSGNAVIYGNETREDQKAMSIQIETLETESFQMDFFRFGHGEKTFVILPGLSVTSVMGFADDVAEAYRIFSEDYTVYVFDRKKDLPAAYPVYQMAEDTAAAFRALGLSHVDLFGASQGGMIAMEIAIRHPDLVQNLVFGSTAACMEEARYKTVEKWIDLAGAGDKEALYLAFGEALYPPDVFEKSRGLLTEAAKTVTDEDLDRFIILAEGMKDLNITEDLEKISCPVLVLGSMDDRVLGSDASLQIAEYLNGREDFELYMYDGYGHAVYDLAPDFKERIYRFLMPEALN